MWYILWWYQITCRSQRHYVVFIPWALIATFSLPCLPFIQCPSPSHLSLTIQHLCSRAFNLPYIWTVFHHWGHRLEVTFSGKPFIKNSLLTFTKHWFFFFIACLQCLVLNSRKISIIHIYISHILTVPFKICLAHISGSICRWKKN